MSFYLQALAEGKQMMLNEERVKSRSLEFTIEQLCDDIERQVKRAEQAECNLNLRRKMSRSLANDLGAALGAANRRADKAEALAAARLRVLKGERLRANQAEMTLRLRKEQFHRMRRQRDAARQQRDRARGNLAIAETLYGTSLRRPFLN